MKQFIFIISVLLLCWSCEKELDLFQGDAGIYFDKPNTLLDTIDIPWGLKESAVTSQIVKLRVLLFGDVKEYDRKFSVRVKHDENNPLEAEEGKDYRDFSKEFVIPALKSFTDIEIEVLRNPVLQDEPRILTIELEKGDELGFPYTRTILGKDSLIHYVDLQRVIKMTENFPIPSWWSYYGRDYFGTWSMKKAITICDEMGIDREVWLTVPNTTNDFTSGYLKYCGVYMHRWLQKQNPPIMDGDSPMEMGKSSKY